MTTKTQKAINWNRAHLASIGLSATEAKLLEMLRDQGEKYEDTVHWCGRMTISKRNAATALGCSPNGFIKAARRLESRGVLRVLDLAKPSTYVVSWTLVNQLEPPPDPIAQIPSFPETIANSSPVVTGGHSVVTRAPGFLEKDKKPGNRVTGSGNPGRRVRLELPWSRRGIDDPDLRRAVAAGDWEFLDQLFDEAARMGWIEHDGEEISRRRFYLLAHHAVATDAIASKVGFCRGRLERGDVARGKLGYYRQESSEWSGRLLDRRREALADPEAAEFLAGLTNRIGQDIDVGATTRKETSSNGEKDYQR